MLSWTFIKQIHMDEIFEANHLRVMQFTGLKDKNGKEIYEGDIIQHWAFPKGNLFDVQWDESAGAFSGYGVFDEWKDSEVVGNIYENPNLLQTV